jgi:hypothetical protein
MTNKEAIKFLKEPRMWEWLNVAQQIALDMAIDALSQEPCEDDAISRQVAIDIVEFECGEWKGLAKEIVKRFNGLPPVQPKPKIGHWIPVSERLPEIRRYVLCQCRGNNYSVLRLNHDSDWECVYPRTTYMQSFVIAWMPLPEPYKPQESEDKK